MRLALIITSLLVGSAAFANCLGEAQIISKVTGINKTLASCQAQVTAQSVSFYQENQLCPLLLEDVVNTAVEVGLNKDGHCQLNIGDTLTGILVLKADGTIVIE